MRGVKEFIVNKLQTMVQKVNPNFSIEVYGSHNTGLCLHWSDIDVCVSSENEMHSYEPKEILDTID